MSCPRQPTGQANVMSSNEIFARIEAKLAANCCMKSAWSSNMELPAIACNHNSRVLVQQQRVGMNFNLLCLLACCCIGCMCKVLLQQGLPSGNKAQVAQDYQVLAFDVCAGAGLFDKTMRRIFGEWNWDKIFPCHGNPIMAEGKPVLKEHLRLRSAPAGSF